MSFYDELIARTHAEREGFQSIPLIRGVLGGGAVTRGMYIDFLTQAYHHVKHTFPLLASAAARTTDASYQKALLSYMNEERGHDEWILDDLRAIGGDAEAVRNGRPGAACELMVAYSYYAIEHVSPFALLGSVHVLEGMSVALAHGAAGAIQAALGVRQEEGFSYLRSHGTLDIQHVAFFRELVDGFADGETREIVVRSSKMFYKLYGDIFRELGTRHGVTAYAA
ncbi:MAG: iron-containing redox enzyme family protein [Methylocystis sp.]